MNKVKGGSLTETEKKKAIAESFTPTSIQKAKDDFTKLKRINCSNIKDYSQGIKTGNEFVNFFTKVRRYDTKGNKGISFYDLIEKKGEYRKKPYIRRYLNQYGDTPQSWMRIASLYFGAVSIFKPIIAMNIYCRYKPKSVLDFTMGWGGRLVGACALNIEKYTGIDMNASLRKPYAEMVDNLEDETTTDITLLFQDALTVDYSKIEYDMVLTSPPYYNIETYKGQTSISKDKWDAEFYEPIFTTTYKHLKKGGYYCLNVPEEVFTRVCLKVLGEPTEYLPLFKNKRTTNEKYTEYIYIWKK